MWFILSLVSSFTYSFRRFSEKSLTQKADHFTLGFAVQAFSLPVMAILLIFSPIPNVLTLTRNFWIPLVIIWFILYPVQAYFYYKSLKEGDISYVLPLMSLIPIFTIISSWILLKEIPSFYGFIGILAIVAGIYALNMRSNKKILSPLLHLFTDKPSLFMIINCFCLATGSTLDKIAITASNPFYYAFINTLGASIILFFIALAVHPKFYRSVTNNVKDFARVGLLQSIAFISFTVALSIGIVPYVAAIKSSSVLLSSIWGVIFLKESLNKNKIFAFCFICIGLIFVAFA